MRNRLSLAILVACIVAAAFFGGRLARPKAETVAPAVTEKPTEDVGAASISAIIVPHHDLVKEVRAAFFADIAKKIRQPKTVVLIGPNHSDAGKAMVQTTDRQWNTSEGTIDPASGLISKLKDAGAGIEPGTFENEHAIKLMLGDVRRTFPGANIVPILFKSGAKDADVSAAVTALADCGECLLVSSVDFSHYQPSVLASLHDDLSIRALENLDTKALNGRAETDSAAALTFTVQWAKNHGTEAFKIFAHTNSGEITADADAETTTHVLGWYESGNKTKPESSVSFLMGGDMMFGRAVQHAYLKGDDFTAVAENIGPRLFWGTDAGIINLEGPVSETVPADNPNPKDLIFNFAPQSVDVLSWMHVNVASLGNNHSANQGKAGLASTRALLEKAGIAWTGGPADTDVEYVSTVEGEGLKLHVIGVHCLASQPDLTALIKRLRATHSDRVLVYPHCGNEYQPKHSSLQERTYKAYIDAGADIVVGAHPHVIQDAELYKGKPIIYSLGNLLFDQDFSRETQEGMLIGGEFTDEGLTFFGLPVSLEKYRPILMRGGRKNQLLDALYKPFSEYIHEGKAGAVVHIPLG